MRAKRAGKIWNWTVASKHVIIECERSEPENFSNWTVASEASGNSLENFAFSPQILASKLRSDYLFSFQKRTTYLFPAFSRSEYLFPKSASPPPPPQNQMVVPLIDLKINIHDICILHLANNIAYMFLISYPDLLQFLQP